MKPEAQRIAIAEACGYRTPPEDDDEAREKGWWYAPPGDNSCKLATGIPDYISDLNAMHEAEKVLTQEQVDEYVYHLGEVQGRCQRTDLKIMASAPQKAEALLRALGLWEEVSGA